MRYRLRTLLIVLALGPPLIAGTYRFIAVPLLARLAAAPDSEPFKIVY